MIPELRELAHKLCVANAEADIVCNCDLVMGLSVGPEIEAIAMRRYGIAREEIVKGFGEDTADDMWRLVAHLFEQKYYGRARFSADVIDRIRIKHDITKEDESFILYGE